jgi:glutamine amidotransferase
MNIALIDYGMGNLGSVRRSLEELGARVDVVAEPKRMREAHALILPGVGAFGAAMKSLQVGGWSDELKHQVLSEGKPLLGICLGMQLLGESSEESEDVAGLGFVKGRVSHLSTLGCPLRVPHVGWDDVAPVRSEGLLRGIVIPTDFYFVHSYAFVPQSASIISGVCNYGIPVVAAIESSNIFGTQFHPEKSAKAGRQVLQNFLAIAKC